MNDQAFRELLDILSIEGDGFRSGVRLRKNALLKWLEEWVEELNAQQGVINYNNLPSNFQDALKERLAMQMLEGTSQNVRYDIDSNIVKAKLYVIKRNKNNGER